MSQRYPPLPPSVQVIIHQDKIYLSHGAERARLIPTYHALIQRVRLRVKLPDMVIPLNPGQLHCASIVQSMLPAVAWISEALLLSRVVAVYLP